MPAGETAALPRGEIVDPVTSLSDPEQSYALYLPSAYDPGRRWPVLLVLDARGRGELAAEVFEDAAERYGWIVLSSNGSRSDDTMEPNERAFRALLGDAERRFAVDPRRFYLAGFSGTARIAWSFALGLAGHVPGVIAVGAGHPEPAPPAAELPFAVFAAAGNSDFNYLEVRATSELLAAAGVPYRFEVFDGLHGWMPPELATEAVGWLELGAMHRGLAPRDPALIARLHDAWLARARDAEREGRTVEAWRRFGEVARDFEGLAEVADAAAAAERLGGSEAVAAWRAETARQTLWEEERRREASDLVAELATPQTMPTPRVQARAEALIRGLQKEAHADPESPRGLAARRALAYFYTALSFYLPRRFLGAGDYARAAIALDLSTLIHDANPLAWYNLACARARLGQKKKALDALERAVAAGWTDLDHLRTDPDLEPLRGDPRFRELSRVDGGRRPGRDQPR